jgi:selenocysteine lyase/cysteine desulfurase
MFPIIKEVEKRILDLTDLLIEKIKGLGLELQTPEEPEHQSGIVNFKTSNPAERARKLAEKGFIVSARSHEIEFHPISITPKKKSTTL